MASQGGGQQAGMQPTGPPYIPKTWSLGGTSTIGTDVPTTAVLMFLYILGAVTHMTIFQLNRRHEHKFIFSALTFGFCMARTVTCILRIASTCLPHNIRLAIAASIFLVAGVLLLFVINLFFTVRLVRSMHPKFGWSKPFSLFLPTLIGLILVTLAIVITATVQSFYTLRPRTRTIDRDLQLYAATFLAIISFLPIPMLSIALLVPRHQRPEKFGSGRHRTKIITLYIAAFLLCLGASYRCGTSWKTPVPRSQPLPTYFHKACLYVFDFVVEIIVVFLYAAMRIDLRMHVPNGAKGPGSYAPSRVVRDEEEDEGVGADEKEKREVGQTNSSQEPLSNAPSNMPEARDAGTGR